MKIAVAPEECPDPNVSPSKHKVELFLRLGTTTVSGNIGDLMGTERVRGRKTNAGFSD